MYERQNMLRQFLTVSLISSLLLAACGHHYYAVEYLFYRKNTYLPDEQGDLSKAQLDAPQRQHHHFCSSDLSAMISGLGLSAVSPEWI